MNTASMLKLTLLASLAALWSQAATMTPGAGRFEFKHAGKTVPIWYYLPEKAGPDAPILFVMHGVNRDADRYRNEWQPHAQKFGFVLVAPEFSRAEFPGDDAYNFGGAVDDQGRPQPPGQWSFNFIEPIFEAVKGASGNRSPQYSMYGHSAGAQFVHRFLYFVPQARVAHVVAANAGWYTLPDPKVNFPYGLHGSGVSDATLKAMLQRPLVLLLGTADTDPNHKNLRRTPEALAQGPYRFARGQNFYHYGQKQAAALGVPLGWKLATAPGIGHHDEGMAAFAVEWLYGHPAINGRDLSRVRVLLGGDTSFGESYQEEYAKKGGTNILVEKGYEYPLRNLSHLLKAVDFRIINLETPLTTRHESELKTKDYLHYSDPVQAPRIFSQYGPIAFSLANNHTLDQGVAGLQDTCAALEAVKAQWFGAGTNLAAAARPLLQPLLVGDKVITLAVFGAFEYRKDYDEQYRFYAQAHRPGTAPISVPAVKQAIASLRHSHSNLYVVHFAHWGGNYKWTDAEQKQTARGLREAGVDLVMGAGAHMLQEVEHDGREWIFYSVGNFLFNARGRYATNHAPPFGAPLVVDFSIQDNRLQTIFRLYPIVSDNQLTGYQPRFVNEAEIAEIDKLLAEKSGWHGAVRAAVKRGKDEVGPYLEFLPAR